MINEEIEQTRTVPVMQQCHLKTLYSISLLALDAVRYGLAEVTIPLLKEAIPAGDMIHIGEKSGPLGRIEFVSRRATDTATVFVVVASFKPVAVIVWCDKERTRIFNARQ